MISYKALTRANITLQTIEDIAIYDCEIFSSNGNILQPYDLQTTLTGVVYDNFKDITKEFDTIKWTMWNENPANNEAIIKWNENHINKNPITITDKEINGKVVIQFEAYKKNSLGVEILKACKRITIIDINDIIATTNKPNNPYDNQLWVDSSTDPATIWIWQNNKWNRVGTISAVVKNLIRNSNFITYSYEPFEIVGNPKNIYTPTVKPISGRNWLNIKSDAIIYDSKNYKGISQTTEENEKINTNSKYSFQFLAFANSTSELYNNSIIVKIISIDEYNLETEIYVGGLKDEITLNKNVCRFFTSFTTLTNTKRLRVEIVGKESSRFDFNVTQLALYNTDNDYPWQSHPEDSSSLLNPENIFNALTHNGEIQGIYSAVDPNTGQLQYYFNAEYIKSGTLKGEYIDARNLIVSKDDGTKTLYIDKDGNVYLTVSSLNIGTSTLDEYVDNKVTPIHDVLDPIASEWAGLKLSIEGVTTDVGKIQETVKINSDGIEEVKNDIKTVKEEVTAEAITTRVENNVMTNNQINQHITSVATQSAQGFNQAVVDELNGNFSKLEQTVNGFSERISDLDNKPNYRLEMYTPDGTVLRSAALNTVVYAKVYNWEKDITDEIDETKFNWYRRSRDKESDDYWNREYGLARKSITITTDDINNYATFYFTVDI